MGDEDENDVEDTSGYSKSGVRLAKTSYRGNYTPNRDSYLPYRGW